MYESDDLSNILVRCSYSLKAELEERLDNVLNTNNRGWLKKCTGLAGQWHYLASGAHRDVYKGVYLRGPRKDQPCVKKV